MPSPDIALQDVEQLRKMLLRLGEIHRDLQIGEPVTNSDGQVTGLKRLAAGPEMDRLTTEAVDLGTKIELLRRSIAIPLKDIMRNLDFEVDRPRMADWEVIENATDPLPMAPEAQLAMICSAINILTNVEFHLKRLSKMPSPGQANDADEDAALSSAAVVTEGDQPEIVVLLGRGKPCKVLGKEKRKLTDAQYDVIKALKEAGEAGLSKDGIEAVRPSARSILRNLRDEDTDWARVISFPGRTGGGYRLIRP